jgi:hypothetical protein
MPSHQTSPSSVSATLVKMMFSFSVAMALKLVFSLVPGATPKKPASGLIAYRRPSLPGLIQAMSSPTVVTFQPPKDFAAGSAWRSWSCRRPRGRRRRRRSSRPRATRRRGSACVRPASPRRAPWSRRCAGRSTSCRAGRCRRSRNRRTRSRASRGSGTMYLVLLQGHLTSFWPGSSGWPTLCRQGTKVRRRCRAGRAPHAAHAGHDAHVDHDIGAVGEFDADVGDRRADGTHGERDDVHGASAHAALEQAAQGFLHLVRVFPVVVGAGIVGSVEQT